MCKVFEDVWREGQREGREEARKAILLQLLEDGKYTLEELSGRFGLSRQELEALRAGQDG